VKEQALQFEPPAAPGLEFLNIGAGSSVRRIAFLRRVATVGRGRAGLVWLGGFRSNMRGEKASDLDRAAAAAGRACLRFDYSGHGESGGRFERATIGMWLEESLAAFRALTEGPQILVGSSMGGWLALLAARALAAGGARLQGLVLIAPAVDMTEKLIFEKMTRKARAELDKKGVWLRASPYEPEPHPISREFIEEGRSHLLFGGAIRSHCPVHILQGMQDEAVPWRHALALVEHMPGDPVTLTFVKDGDHRLSRPQDLARIWAAVEGMDDHRLDKPSGLV
jgi:pimeloyl-ACP methyl ester carboxylesterase